MDIGALAHSLYILPWSFDEDAFVATVEAAGWVPGRAKGSWRAWARDDAEMVAYFHDGTVTQVEVDLDTWDLEDYGDFDDYTIVGLDANLRYERQVETVTATLGPPVFDGRPLDLDPADEQPTDGTPTCFECARYALWPMPGARFMVQYQWDDKECPLVVSIRINEVKN